MITHGYVAFYVVVKKQISNKETVTKQKHKNLTKAGFQTISSELAVNHSSKYVLLDVKAYYLS